MTKEELELLTKTVGDQAAAKIKQEMEGYEKKAKEIAAEAVKNGGITKEQFDEVQAASKKALEEVKAIAEKQGLSITQLQEKLSNEGSGAVKSIAEVLKDDTDELKEIHRSRHGAKEYLITINHKGEFVINPRTKAAGPHGTIGDIGTAGNVASVLQSINSASILRLGGNAPIISQYRNTPWIFDLCNVQNASMDTMFALWYEEQEKQGAPGTVAEGGTRPTTQYQYTLKSSEYKNKGVLISFTNEFVMDFARLQSDILGKGRTDLINSINEDCVTDIKSKATAYNTPSDFGTAPSRNDYHVLAAMAAQVDSATYGANANAAIMSTFKKYSMGTLTDADGNFINRPTVLDNLAFVGNSGMAADDILVGDFMNYNIILRGGLILRIGYNGTDFADGKFSTVLEQYYFNYISPIRTKAIVKGPDFATVKTAITTP